MRAAACRVTCERDRALAQIAAMMPIDQSAASASGADQLAGDAHVDRLFDADQPRQPLRAFGAWNDAEIDFRLTQARVGQRHPVVACHREFEAATDWRPVQRHDHRLRRVLDRAQHVVHFRERRTLVPGRAFELGDIRARHERPAGAHDDNGADGRIPPPLERQTQRSLLEYRRSAR